MRPHLKIKKIKNRAGMVAHTYLWTLGRPTRKNRVWGQPGLHPESLPPHEGLTRQWWCPPVNTVSLLLLYCLINTMTEAIYKRKLLIWLTVPGGFSPWWQSEETATSSHLDPQPQSKDSKTRNHTNLLTPQSLPPVTHSFNKARPPHSSQALLPRGNQILKYMMSYGNYSYSNHYTIYA